MIGVLVNAGAVLIGSLLGLIFNKGIPKKYSDGIMIGIGLCIIYIGIEGALKGENPLIVISSIVIGVVLGIKLDLDGKINSIGGYVEKRVNKDSPIKVPIVEGFITASLLFCIGAMAIVGSLNAGLSGDYEMLFTKSMLDFVSAIILTASLGIGVAFAAIPVFLFQGTIVMVADHLQPILSEGMIAEITCVGSLLIIAIGLNLAKITEIKIVDYLPALLIAPFISWILTFF